MVEWFVNDVAGIVCSSMTYLLVLYSQFVVITVILLPDPLVSTAIQVHTGDSTYGCLTSPNPLFIEQGKQLHCKMSEGCDHVIFQVGVFTAFSFLALWSHLKAMTTNPGKLHFLRFQVYQYS